MVIVVFAESCRYSILAYLPVKLALTKAEIGHLANIGYLST